jgi:hypothetical protein
MSGQAIDFSKYEQAAPAGGGQIDFSKYESAAPPAKTEQPGFLDKDIPLAGPWYNPTLSGVQSIGRGVRGAVQGIGHAIAHPIDTATETAKSIQAIPSTLKALPGAIRDINASPDPTEHYAKAAQETAGQGAGQALVALGSEGLARGVGSVAKPIASRMYQSALKPSTTLGAARVGRMVDTGLNEGIPVSEGGAAKLSGRIGDVNDEIQSTIDAAPARVISKGKVLQRLNPTAERFAEQVNPTSDLDAIAKSGNEFAETQPSDIPGPAAQKLKQGTYRAIGSKNYGELGGAATEAQKALARGLKEELANAYPELSKLNATDSRLIDLHEALEKAALRSGNREPLGIGGPVLGAATRAATGSSAIGMGAWLAKEAMRNPLVKSRLAIALNAAGKTTGLGASVGAIGGASRPTDDQTNEKSQ